MDKISPELRSENMRRIRSKNTIPEIRVRKLIYGMGYRYRLHWDKLPCKPDIIFPGRKKVIFVHGCFWHQHSDINCNYVHKPKSRLNYWLPKLEKNKQRDIKNQNEIEKCGWKYLVVWECQISDTDEFKSKLKKFLDE